MLKENIQPTFQNNILNMKCKQNSNKNLLGNGYCSVCNEAIMDIHAEQDAKNKDNEEIVNDLLHVNEKLRNGEVVDQND